MKFLPLSFAALMTCRLAAAAVMGSITIRNTAPTSGTCITPPWVGIHTGNIDLYDIGDRLPGFMESLVEDGDNSDLSDVFNNGIEGGAFDGTVFEFNAGGVLCPGEFGTISFEFDEDDFDGENFYLSYATMIIPSNDAFVANDDPTEFLVLSAGGDINEFIITVPGSAVLDAGTELNDEQPSSTAFFGAEVGAGIGTSGVVMVHPGFTPEGPILETTSGTPRNISLIGADFTADGYEVLEIEITAGIFGDEGSSGGGCFSASSMVDVKNVGRVAMKDLQVGDHILTRRNKYEPVYTFGHFDENVSTEFLKISYVNAGKAQALEVTKEHLIFKAGSSAPVRASTLVVGDILTHIDSTEATITKISKVKRNGIYAPLTREGTIVVDGIVASVYATLMEKTDSTQIEFNGWTVPAIDQATFLHFGVAPLRMICGLSSQLSVCQTDGNKMDDRGYHPYVSWGVDMIHWVESQNCVVQGFFTAVFFAAFSVMTVVDGVAFGARNTWLKLVMSVGTIALFYATGRKSQKTAA